MLRGNGFCSFHGGYNELNAYLKSVGEPNVLAQRTTHTGLYSEALRSTFSDARSRLIFNDPSTVRIDVKPEIRNWRTKIEKWQREMESGKTYFESDKGMPVLYEELIEKATTLLARLIKLQAKLHPNEAASGELTINVKVKGQAADQDVPDLEEPQPSPREQVAEPPKEKTYNRHELEELISDD